MPPCSLMSSTNGLRISSGRSPFEVTPNWAKVFSLKTTAPMVMVSSEMPRSVEALVSMAWSGGTTPPDPLAALGAVDGALKPESDEPVDLDGDVDLVDVVVDLWTLHDTHNTASAKNPAIHRCATPVRIPIPPGSPTQ